MRLPLALLLVAKKKNDLMEDAAVNFEPIGAERYSSIKELVTDAIGGGVQTEDITGGTNLYDLGLDSFNVINLLIGIESRFGATIAPEELTEEVFKRFDSLVELVERHL